MGENGQHPRSPQIRAAQRGALQALEHAHERIQQARERDPDLCQGFSAYGGVREELSQAGELLERRSYRVALAGMMSAGKSTLANALLNRPDLLPTGIEETTLTITVVREAEPGREGLTVHYLTEEEALRGIFERGHYVKHFPLDVVTQARAGATQDELREVIERLVKQGEMPDDVRQQLIGFLQALDERRALLGTTIHPSLDDRRTYLAPRTHFDVGHLLLIAKAEIRIENELFAREGLEIVDLPGADSTNERQRRIAHQYLQDTDVLLAIPNAAGFRFVDVEILDRFRAARGSIRERVFFVLNRFDEAKVAELGSPETSLSYFKKIVDTLARDYEPGNLFFTVGLWASLEERRRRSGGLSPEDQKQLDRLRATTTELAEHFEKQGVLERIEREWNERYASRVATSVRAISREGGVPRLRDELIHYLKHELELARLREIQMRLTAALHRVEDLIGPERSRVAGFLDSARDRLRATADFLHQLAYLTRAALEGAHDELARREGETDEYGFQLLMRGLSDQFRSAIEAVLGEDNDLIDFRRLAREASVESTEVIMQRIIDHSRAVLSQKFVEQLTTKLAADFARRYRDALHPLDNEQVLAQLERALDRPGLRQRYERRLSELEASLGLLTRLRALEETWTVAQQEFTPAPGSRPFEEVEARFRRALIAELQELYDGSFKALGEVLLKHYRVVLDDFLAGFEEITAEALQEARQQGASLPVGLLAVRCSAAERQRFGLAELVNATDGASQAVATASATLVG
jgi:hypothetical protein